MMEFRCSLCGGRVMFTAPRHAGDPGKYKCLECGSIRQAIVYQRKPTVVNMHKEKQ